MGTLLKINNVTKSYSIYNKPVDRLKESLLLIGKREYKNTFTAVNDVSFELKRGESLGIIGANGAGKSTILKIITGIVVADDGTVERYGVIESLLELGSSFNLELNGYQNIDIFLKLRGIDSTKYPELVEQIIEFSELGDFISQPVKTYSSGMFARLAFSSAIHSDFDILIVDEILSVGDVNFQNKCISKMKEFINEQKSIIFVSHDMHSIKYFCDVVIRMDHGKIIELGNDVVNIVERFENNVLPDDITAIKDFVVSGSDKVKITNVIIRNSNGIEATKLKFQEEFSVEIEYYLNEYIDGMFFGVGFRNSKNEYVCGLNTKIDGFKLSSNIGSNKIVLKYKNVNLYTDSFTLWATCYNSTGTVVLTDYIIRNAFSIVSDEQYCEGVTYIEHEWE